MTPATTESGPHPLGYEPKDASVRVVTITAGVLALLVAGSIGFSAWYYVRHYTTQVAAGIRQSSFKQAANYQTSIAQEWPKLNREVEEHLHTYGWVDRPHGVVRIPIDRAMDLVAEEGAKKP